MSTFNSLGSNYSARFVLKSLITVGSNWSTEKLRKQLTGYYGGEATFTYKGRYALELALKNAGLPKNSFVAINGFTCFEVYQAVERAGFKNAIIDIAPNQLNFDIAGLKKAHSKYKKGLSAIIVQNTLGLPADIGQIEKYCKENKITIIEDLAHSLGAVYADGREAGKVGSFVMFSFSQDKPLDVVAGGALISQKSLPIDIATPTQRISVWQREINAQYPMWTALIRGTYSIKLGRYIHFGFRKLHLLATPMGNNSESILAMEPSATKLLLGQWKRKAQIEAHRRAIAEVYKKQLPKSVQFDPVSKSQPLYLRFPIKVDDPSGLVSYLKKYHIYIGDVWYDAPIGPLRYLSQTDYQTGECPNAEKLAKTMVNLPTHIRVSEKQAERIAQEVNQWLKSK